MLKLIWTSCSIILIILILLRLPSKDGAVQSFNVSTGMLGSPKTTDNKLQVFVWSLVLLFLVLSGVRSISVF
jgi:protein translocase SecG subunit